MSTYYILVLYKNYESLKAHVGSYVLGGATYNIKTRELKAAQYIYHYQLVEGIEEFIANVAGKEFSGMFCLEGDYASEVINFAMSKIRRPL